MKGKRTEAVYAVIESYCKEGDIGEVPRESDTGKLQRLSAGGAE